MAHKNQTGDNPLEAEHAAADDAELADHHQPDDADLEEQSILMSERETDTSEVMPAELAAVHQDTEAAQEAWGDFDEEKTEIRKQLRRPRVGVPTEASGKTENTKKHTTKKTTKETLVKKGPKRRSVRYTAQLAQIDLKRRYALPLAIEFLKKTAYAKFDSAVEVHIRLFRKKGKNNDGERFRTIVHLPHGSGREVKIGVLDEALIAEIKKAGDTEFDVLLAAPALMPKVAQIAKILGPKGKMPNPKTGTVTDDPATAKQAIVSGRIEVRADADSNLHQTIGRVSWSSEKLMENGQALLASLPTHRLRRVVLAATMGPGIPVEL